MPGKPQGYFLPQKRSITARTLLRLCLVMPLLGLAADLRHRGLVVLRKMGLSVALGTVGLLGVGPSHACLSHFYFLSLCCNRRPGVGGILDFGLFGGTPGVNSPGPPPALCLHGAAGGFRSLRRAAKGAAFGYRHLLKRRTKTLGSLGPGAGFDCEQIIVRWESAAAQPPTF